MSHLKALFASLEDNNDINDTDLVVSPDQTVENEVFEVSAADTEVVASADDVEQLEEIHEGLESICVSLESALADGGLDPAAAVFMQHSVDAYTNRLGIPSNVASLESFGGASGKAGATSISLESIKETIQKVWQAIKNAVLKAIAAVKNFFAKIFGGVKKLKERSTSLKKSVSDLGSKKAKGKIKVPSANTLRFNGKADIASINNGLSNTETIGTMVTQGMVDGAREYYNKAAQAITNAAANKASTENILQEALTSAGAPYVAIAAKVTQASKAMSGDAVYKFTETDEDAQGTKLSIPKLTKAAVGKSISENLEIDAPDASSLSTVLGHVDKIIGIMESKKANFEALTKAREAAVAQSEKFVDIVKSGKINGAIKNAHVSMALRGANRDLARPISEFFNHGFAVVRAALALVDRGVSAHS